jgi:hypothetical protein
MKPATVIARPVRQLHIKKVWITRTVVRRTLLLIFILLSCVSGLHE